MNEYISNSTLWSERTHIPLQCSSHNFKSISSTMLWKTYTMTKWDLFQECKGWFNIRKLIIIHHLNKPKRIKHMIFFIDAEKGFDKFQHSLMIKTPNRHWGTLSYNDKLYTHILLLKLVSCLMGRQKRHFHLNQEQGKNAHYSCSYSTKDCWTPFRTVITSWGMRELWSERGTLEAWEVCWSLIS